MGCDPGAGYAPTPSRTSFSVLYRLRSGPGRLDWLGRGSLHHRRQGSPQRVTLPALIDAGGAVADEAG